MQKLLGQYKYAFRAIPDFIASCGHLALGTGRKDCEKRLENGVGEPTGACGGLGGGQDEHLEVEFSDVFRRSPVLDGQEQLWFLTSQSGQMGSASRQGRRISDVPCALAGGHARPVLFVSQLVRDRLHLCRAHGAQLPLARTARQWMKNRTPYRRAF